MKILKTLWEYVLFFTPRVVTSEVVYELADGGEWVPVCEVKDIQPGEYYERVGKVRSFQWLWFGFDYLEEYPLRKFDNRRPRG